MAQPSPGTEKPKPIRARQWDVWVSRLLPKQTTIVGSLVDRSLSRLRSERFSVDGPPGHAKLFHSTSSDAWPGFAKIGALTPGNELKGHDIEVGGGEGAFVGDLSGYVALGEGEAGFGTSRSYFDRLESSPMFAPGAYDNAQLKR